MSSKLQIFTFDILVKQASSCKIVIHYYSIFQPSHQQGCCHKECLAFTPLEGYDLPECWWFSNLARYLFTIIPTLSITRLLSQRMFSIYSVLFQPCLQQGCCHWACLAFTPFDHIYYSIWSWSVVGVDGLTVLTKRPIQPKSCPNKNSLSLK